MFNRGQRTSRLWIIIRAGLALYLILFVPCFLLWLVTGIKIPIYFPPNLPALLGTIAGVAIMMLFGWVGTQIGAWLLLGGTEEYKQWRRDKFDVYFDNLPEPFNLDSWSVRLTGHEESDHCCDQGTYTDADGLATLPCPSCGASVKEPWVAAFIDPGVRCWNCQKTMKLCTSCANLVGEPVVGAFSRSEGVSCPFCGRVMRM